jgi:hypothetical protein
MVSCLNCHESVPDGTDTCPHCAYKIVHASATRAFSVQRPAPAAPMKRQVCLDVGISPGRDCKKTVAENQNSGRDPRLAAWPRTWPPNP